MNLLIALTIVSTLGLTAHSLPSKTEPVDNGDGVSVAAVAAAGLRNVAAIVVAPPVAAADHLAGGLPGAALVETDNDLGAEVDAGPIDYIYFHDGHCAAGWMGNTLLHLPTRGRGLAYDQYYDREECYKLCGQRDGCGYFAHEPSTRTCALYQGYPFTCPDDDNYGSYKAYKMIRSFSFFHNGHCAAGWMGDNVKTDTVDDCGRHCISHGYDGYPRRAGSGCFFFAYEYSSGTCAIYQKSADCPDDNNYGTYKAYVCPYRK